MQKRELGKKILFLSLTGIFHLLNGAFEVTSWSSKVVTFCDLTRTAHFQDYWTEEFSLGNNVSSMKQARLHQVSLQLLLQLILDL